MGGKSLQGYYLIKVNAQYSLSVIAAVGRLNLYSDMLWYIVEVHVYIELKGADVTVKCYIINNTCAALLISLLYTSSLCSVGTQVVESSLRGN